MAEREPLDLQPLSEKYPSHPTEKDLLLGDGHRVDLGQDIHADIFVKHKVLRVETPIEAFTLTGLRSITVADDTVAFHSVRGNYAASLTFFADGSIQNEVKALTPLAPHEALPSSIPQQDNSPASEVPPVPEVEQRTVKGNIGTDPLAITTEKGQMYFFAFGIHNATDKAKEPDKQKPDWIKVGIPIGEEGLVIDPSNISEDNPSGLRLRKGDFMQLVLEPGTWKQLTIANKDAKRVSTTTITGYYLKESTMLKQKKR